MFLWGEENKMLKNGSGKFPTTKRPTSKCSVAVESEKLAMCDTTRSGRHGIMTKEKVFDILGHMVQSLAGDYPS